MKALQQTYRHSISIGRNDTWKKFITWCENQDENRYGWLAAGIFGHGCILAPITLLVTAMSGVSMLFFSLVILSMAAVLVSNLAALPTKYTIPVLFASIMVNLMVIVASLV
jgi:hypothetical protein